VGERIEGFSPPFLKEQEMGEFVFVGHYGPIKGGRNAGLLAFNIDLNPITGTIEDIVSRINAWESRTKLVKLSASSGFEAAQQTFDILTLMRSLKDNGYQIMVSSYNPEYFSWFALADYLQIFVDDKPWIGFKCSEIVYTPFEDTLTEPKISPSIALQANLLVNGWGLPKDKVYEFLSKAKWNWNLFESNIGKLHI